MQFDFVETFCTLHICILCLIYRPIQTLGEWRYAMECKMFTELGIIIITIIIISDKHEWVTCARRSTLIYRPIISYVMQRTRLLESPHADQNIHQYLSTTNLMKHAHASWRKVVNTNMHERKEWRNDSWQKDDSETKISHWIEKLFTDK